jgi:hypothetical protein
MVLQTLPDMARQGLRASAARTLMRKGVPRSGKHLLSPVAELSAARRLDLLAGSSVTVYSTPARRY